MKPKGSKAEVIKYINNHALKINGQEGSTVLRVFEWPQPQPLPLPLIDKEDRYLD